MTCVSVNLKRLARALAVILTFASFASFASCAEETVGSAETTAPEVTATAEETEVGDDLPALDFDGYAFRIVTREVGHIDYKMNVDDINGEPINDAIYNRNRIIEQRFDTVITETYSDHRRRAIQARTRRQKYRSRSLFLGDGYGYVKRA